MYKCLECNATLFKGPVEGWYNCLHCGIEFSKTILSETPQVDVELEDLHEPLNPMKKGAAVNE